MVRHWDERRRIFVLDNIEIRLNCGCMEQFLGHWGIEIAYWFGRSRRAKAGQGT